MRDDDIVGMIEERLSRLDREEQTALTIGFLERNNDIARRFVRYCASASRGVGGADAAWDPVTDALDRIEERERTMAEREQREAFLGELEAFRGDCLAHGYVECADFEDKRRAYADGDIYFEDFVDGFIDDHDGFQAFIRYTREADRYFRLGDHATAGRAYGILLDIYRRDTEDEHLFVDDDDFPDLDLSQLDGVDVGRLEKRHESCLKAMPPGTASHEGSGRASGG